MEAAQGRRGAALEAPLRIVDEHGDGIAEFGYDEKHGSSFRLLGPGGGTAVALGVDGLGGFIAVSNHDVRRVVLIDVESWGGRVQVTYPDGEAGVILFGGDAGEDAGGLLKVLTTPKFEGTYGPGFALRHDAGLQADA